MILHVKYTSLESLCPCVYMAVYICELTGILVDFDENRHRLMLIRDPVSISPVGPSVYVKYPLTHFHNTKISLVQTKSILQTTNLVLLKALHLSFKGKKALWETEKMLFTSIFSFSHDVFILSFRRGVKSCYSVVEGQCSLNLCWQILSQYLSNLSILEYISLTRHFPFYSSVEKMFGFNFQHSKL